MVKRSRVILSVLVGFVLVVIGGDLSAAGAQPSWSLKMTVPMELSISTVDIDRMLKYYTEVLGLKLVADVKAGPEMSIRTGATPHGYRIVRLQTPYGERIKLVQAGKPPKLNEVPNYVCERQGFASLTFVIADLDGVIKRLKEHGVKLLSGGEKVEVRPGVFAIYSLDPEGNFVEFVEYPDAPSYRPDLFKWHQFF
ncbi:MAG: VOC family protein [Thermodesulfobacteriota bacterium]|jgi:catechol 2,3-dioxygenase-like lactoylglutathione lyase family enzyme